MKRVKRRYLAVAVESQDTFSSNEILDAVWGAITKLYGEYGAGKAGMSLIDYDGERKRAIIRTGHLTLEMVRTALASITKIRNERAAVRVLKVSGTIKALCKKVEQ